ncbi:MAG: hypothetical protein IJ747_08495 [Lachnospiraceae bacterium]|nr:hypothetical protein [Lachnospiraceae bacterium]
MDNQGLYRADVQNQQLNPFALASFICGMLSTFVCCTGILPLFFGAFGILFAVLSKRLGKPTPPLSSLGLFLSCLGIVLGLSMCGFVLYQYLTDEEYRNIVNQYYQQYSNGIYMNNL